MFPLKCIICANEYASKQKFKKHQEVHSPCTYCGYISLTFVDKKNHAKLHEVVSVSPSIFTLQQSIPSTSTAAIKRPLPLELASPISSKYQRMETNKECLRNCEDCNLNIPSMKWFRHCAEETHKTNIQKLIGSRVQLLRRKFRNRILAYRFPKGDFNLNVENYLKEGKMIFRKLLNNNLADNVLIKFNLEIAARYKLPTSPLMTEQDIYHISEMILLSRTDDIDDVLGTQIDVIKTKMSEFQERDSGWTLIQIKWLDLNINKASPIPGSHHITTPLELARKKACINVKNDDVYCFKWSLVAAFIMEKI